VQFHSFALVPDSRNGLSMAVLVIDFEVRLMPTRDGRCVESGRHHIHIFSILHLQLLRHVQGFGKLCILYCIVLRILFEEYFT
jgi:hypothetical protein